MSNSIPFPISPSLKKKLFDFPPSNFYLSLPLPPPPASGITNKLLLRRSLEKERKDEKKVIL